MDHSKKAELLRKEIDGNRGILRLSPTWVPRKTTVPGRRLKLHPKDLYKLGTHRGGLCERWLASTTKASNGPETPPDEGLSYVVIDLGSDCVQIQLKEAIELLGDLILGKEIMSAFGGWGVLSKFFDNEGAIPFHMHQREEHARKVGKKGKPEAYYFPEQLNQIENKFPFTFFGLRPETTKDQIRNCILRWDEGDNHILQYSTAHKLSPKTGWYVPDGILHAPGSLATYELQRAVDIGAVFQSMLDGRPILKDALLKDVPREKHDDLDYLIDMIDWEVNTDPLFAQNFTRFPKPSGNLEQMNIQGYEEYWVMYDNPYFAAKELTIYPNSTVNILDDAAYGLIAVQGYGLIEGIQLETPTLIRYGDLTSDEFFVVKDRAKQGVQITNMSNTEALVILKHFGPGIKDAFYHA